MKMVGLCLQANSAKESAIQEKKKLQAATMEAASKKEAIFPRSIFQVSLKPTQALAKEVQALKSDLKNSQEHRKAGLV